MALLRVHAPVIVLAKGLKESTHALKIVLTNGSVKSTYALTFI